MNAGFIVSIVMFIIITLLSVHLPLLIITFESLTVGETYRTSLYVSIRYIITTLILFVLQACIINDVTVSLFISKLLISNISVVIRFLAVWLLVGISLPVFLQVKFTTAVYYKLSQIDFERIMYQVEDEEDETDE